MSKKAQTVQGLKCLKSKLFWLKSAVLRISIIAALELHSMRRSEYASTLSGAFGVFCTLFLHPPFFYFGHGYQRASTGYCEGEKPVCFLNTFEKYVNFQSKCNHIKKLHLLRKTR